MNTQPTGSAESYPNVNAAWGEAVALALRGAGVTLAVVSPGSRSTPLVFGLAATQGMDCLPVLDERSAAFFALGAARARSEPVALVCTSGTAAAGYFPAVIEARLSGVPLVVLTADRPPELRNCQSGQTIDQQKLYGSYPRLYHELSLPQADEARLRSLRETVRHAVRVSKGPLPGPVHLNVPFRDPLAPIDTGQPLEWPLRGDLVGLMAARPELPTRATLSTRQAKTWINDMADTGRGVIICGPGYAGDGAAYAAQVEAISRHLGWPVLGDGLSPVRNNAGAFLYPVFHYDPILRCEENAIKLRAEAVLQVGPLPTSKVLRAWLAAADAPTWLVDPTGDNGNAVHARTQGLTGTLEALAEAAAQGPPTNAAYAQAWRDCEERAALAMTTELAGHKELFEGKIARVLAESLPEGSDVFIANSMQVRNVEFFWPGGTRAIRVFSSRGANGIDGTLSTALGMAHGGRPGCLLTGDLALLHDTNGFLAARELRGGLTVVLVNNDGGGIFEHLPVSDCDPVFERFFATPQALDFEKLADTYGTPYAKATTWEELASVVGTPWKQGLRLIEVRCDRREDARSTRTILEAVAQASQAT